MYRMPQANVLAFAGRLPRLAEGVFVASGVQLIGDVEVGRDSSLWFNTVVRGDVHHIRIGARTNVQDNSTVHVTSGIAPCIIGDDVTVGHNAIVHACTVEDLCLIGMGAIVLDQARIRTGSLVGAGALVTQGKEFPPYSLIVGSPAKAVRQLTEEERRGLKESALHYVETARGYMGL
jgi:carbonic anhydrase/acetyltransferase-like protein (isoleucine patch superfamily)